MKFFFKKIKKFDKIVKINNHKFHEKKLFKLRKEVNNLFFNHHFDKSMIARKKKVSRNFVIKWTKSPNQNFEKDNRGWKKAKEGNVQNQLKRKSKPFISF